MSSITITITIRIMIPITIPIMIPITVWGAVQKVRDYQTVAAWQLLLRGIFRQTQQQEQRP